MRLIRSTKAGTYEVYNEKAKYLGGTWIQISPYKATELMEKGFELDIKIQKDKYGRRAVLDNGKILAIANNKCQLTISSSSTLYFDTRYGIVEAYVRTYYDNEHNKVYINNASDIMKYMLIYLRLGLKIILGYHTLQDMIRIHMSNTITTIDTILEYNGKVDTYNLSEKETIDRKLYRWYSRLREGELVIESNDGQEIYLELGKDRIEEILKAEGIILWT